MRILSRRAAAPALLLISAIGIGTAASAAPLTNGNLVVLVNEITGSNTAPVYVAEYTTTGTRVQKISDVPPPGRPPGPNDDDAHDLVVGPGNAIYVYDGSFTPYLARLDLATNTWTQQTFAGWSTIPTVSYGGLAHSGQYVYATDTNDGGGAPQGVVRFDTGGGPTVRFATGISPIDLYMSPGNVLYTLEQAHFDESRIEKFDPATLASLGSLTIPFGDTRSIAVAADGTIFAANLAGQIGRFSPTGQLIKSISPDKYFSDIDIDPSGRIALGTAFEGRVGITDLSLDTYTTFQAAESNTGGHLFVSWVPEPSLVLLSPTLLLARRRRRPGRGQAVGKSNTGA